MKYTLALLMGLLVLAAGNLTTRAANATFGTGLNQFDIEFVEVGNANNDDDTSGNPNSVGKVEYDYSIGKYEISQNMIDAASASGSASASDASSASGTASGAGGSSSTG